MPETGRYIRCMVWTISALVGTLLGYEIPSMQATHESVTNVIRDTAFIVLELFCCGDTSDNTSRRRIGSTALNTLVHPLTWTK